MSSLIPSLLFLGGISDEIGRRKTMLIALGLAAIGALVMAFASSLWWLVAGRIFQGLALGIGLSTATATVSEWMDSALESPRTTWACISRLRAVPPFSASLPWCR